MIRETMPTKEAIICATASLLEQGGRDAVSTRAVAAAAGVQVPTIYRQFGDMRGLLDAVVSYVLDRYLAQKGPATTVDDPVVALREQWDCNVNFGLSYPAFYTLLYSDYQPGMPFRATVETITFLEGLVREAAKAGRLRVEVNQAAQMLHAACSGVILTLIGRVPEERDMALSDATREATLDAVLVPAEAPVRGRATPPAQVANRAIALKALLPDATALTTGERLLLAEWLDRLSVST